MPRVLMNFQRYKGWVVNFIEADCRTTIGRRTRYFTFSTEEAFRAFVLRCNLDVPNDFEHSMRAWARGSNYCNLTEEQYRKLK